MRGVFSFGDGDFARAVIVALEYCHLGNFSLVVGGVGTIRAALNFRQVHVYRPHCSRVNRQVKIRLARAVFGSHLFRDGKGEPVRRYAAVGVRIANDFHPVRVEVRIGVATRCG